MKQMCIKQGYVPEDCKFPEDGGMLLFMLVKEGKNPCVGCNINCRHSQVEVKLKKTKFGEMLLNCDNNE